MFKYQEVHLQSLFSEFNYNFLPYPRLDTGHKSWSRHQTDTSHEQLVMWAHEGAPIMSNTKIRFQFDVFGFLAIDMIIWNSPTFGWRTASGLPEGAWLLRCSWWTTSPRHDICTEQWIIEVPQFWHQYNIITVSLSRIINLCLLHIWCKLLNS